MHGERHRDFDSALVGAESVAILTSQFCTRKMRAIRAAHTVPACKSELAYRTFIINSMHSGEFQTERQSREWSALRMEHTGVGSTEVLDWQDKQFNFPPRRIALAAHPPGGSIDHKATNRNTDRSHFWWIRPPPLRTFAAGRTSQPFVGLPICKSFRDGSSR